MSKSFLIPPVTLVIPPSEVKSVVLARLRLCLRGKKGFSLHVLGTKLTILGGLKLVFMWKPYES